MNRNMLDSAGGLTKSATLRKEIISWIKVIVFAVLAAYLINNFVLVNAAIPTGSMENTIMTGDRIVALRLSYIIRSYLFYLRIFGLGKYPNKALPRIWSRWT